MDSLIKNDSLGQFLCCVLANDPAWHRRELESLWRKVGDDAAWEFAVHHEAEGMAAIALARVLGEKMPARWREAHAKVATRIGCYMRELDRIAAALAAEGVRLVALKNSGIARAVFTDLGGCPMGDVDLLVKPTDFAKSHRIFVKHGFHLLGNQDVGREALGARIGGEAAVPDDVAQIAADMLSGGREYSLPIENGEPLWFELQCRSVGGKWISKKSEPDSTELVNRSVAVPGTEVRILAPVDNLLQVSLHTAKHTYVRAPGFRLQTDVDRLVRHGGIDWELFCVRVEQGEVKTAVCLSLLLPAHLMQTPVPEAVLERLGASGWKIRLMLRWLARVGFFYPKRKKWSKLGYIVFGLLLFDGNLGRLRVVFPEREALEQRYGAQPAWSLPYWYLHRIVSLLLKRTKT